MGEGGPLVRGLGPRPLLAPLRRHLPSLGLGVSDSRVKASRPHCGSAEGTGEEPERGDSWCSVAGLNLEPAVPGLEAPQRLEVTRQPTHFLPKLPQVQCATSNLNFARPEGKRERATSSSVRIAGTRCSPAPHPLSGGASGAPPSCGLLDSQGSRKGSLYSKVLAAEAKSGDPGPT